MYHHTYISIYVCNKILLSSQAHTYLNLVHILRSIVQDLSKYVFKLLSCRGNKDIITTSQAQCGEKIRKLNLWKNDGLLVEKRVCVTVRHPEIQRVFPSLYLITNLTPTQITC